MGKFVPMLKAASRKGLRRARTKIHIISPSALNADDLLLSLGMT
jgi:hypothetical protein